jgi:hypothetical protein
MRPEFRDLSVQYLGLIEHFPQFECSVTAVELLLAWCASQSGFFAVNDNGMAQFTEPCHSWCVVGLILLTARLPAAAQCLINLHITLHFYEPRLF